MELEASLSPTKKGALFSWQHSLTREIVFCWSGAAPCTISRVFGLFEALGFFPWEWFQQSARTWCSWPLIPSISAVWVGVCGTLSSSVFPSLPQALGHRLGSAGTIQTP